MAFIVLLPSCARGMPVPYFQPQPLLVVYLGAWAAGCCEVVVASCCSVFPGQ